MKEFVMAYMVILVLAQTDKLDAVVEAWRAVGVSGITVFQSTDLAQVEDRCRRDDLPLFPSMRDIFENEAFDHYTLFAVVENESRIDQLIEAAEREIGDLDLPGNGVLIALPIARAKGLREVGPNQA
jgi:hypothetical protein